MHKSSSAAATPPWTEPIGLYIHSAGSSANTARPRSTSTSDIPKSSAIGGGGSAPVATSRRYSIPGFCSPAAELNS
jgi:hypothetical protein